MKLSVRAGIVSATLLLAPISAGAQGTAPLWGVTIDDALTSPEGLSAVLAPAVRGEWTHPVHVRLIAAREALEPVPGTYDFAALDARLASYRAIGGLDIYLDIRDVTTAPDALPGWLALVRAAVVRGRGLIRGVIVAPGATASVRPPAEEVAFLLKATAVNLRAVKADAVLVLADIGDADEAWLTALYDQDVAPYLDAVASTGPLPPNRLLTIVDARDPSAALAVLGTALGPDPTAAAAQFVSAQLQHLGTRVTGVGYVGSPAAIAAALPALAALRDLIDQPMTTLDEQAAGLSLHRDGAEVTHAVPHRLVFGLDTAATFLVYTSGGEPLDAALREASGSRPVIRDAVRGTRLPATRFRFDQTTRVAAMGLPGAPWPLVADWSVADTPRIERSEVSTSVLPTLAEIIARHQQAQAAQDAALARYLVDATMVQHFRPAVPASGFDVVTENRFYVEPGLTEFEELSFRFNGMRFGPDRPPFPLLQAEKVLSLPLDLRLTSDYVYRLDGTDRVDGRDCFLIRFDPVDEARSLYRGSVWIDRETYQRVKLHTLQTHPGAPVLASEETQQFAVVGQAAGRSVTLLTSLIGRQTFLLAGRSLLVERRLDFHDFVLDPPDFEARRAAARQSNRIMYRDTPAGLRYLVDRDGERVVDDRPTTRAKALLLGVTFDPAYDFPLPLGGLNYINFAFHGPDTQLAVLFGGVLALVNAQKPNLIGERVDGSVDLFAIAVPASDRVYDVGGERPGERVLTIPFTTGLNLGWRLTSALRVTTLYQFRFDAYFRDTTTAPDYQTPASTATHGAGVGLEWKQAGYSAAATWSGFARPDWREWGLPGDHDPRHRTYSRRSVSLAKDFFSSLHTVHLNAAYYGGHDLDRFSEYQFGFFDEHRIQGVPSAGVRFGELGLLRASYTFNLLDQYRVEVSVDRAYGRSGSKGQPWDGITGVGVGFLMRGPRQTMLRGDIGKSFLPRRFREPGSVVFQFQVLKPL